MIDTIFQGRALNTRPWNSGCCSDERKSARLEKLLYCHFSNWPLDSKIISEWSIGRNLYSPKSIPQKNSFLFPGELWLYIFHELVRQKREYWGDFFHKGENFFSNEKEIFFYRPWWIDSGRKFFNPFLKKGRLMYNLLLLLCSSFNNNGAHKLVD